MHRVLLYFLFCHGLVFSQQSVEFEGFGAYNSTGIHRDIPSAFFYGGFIDSLSIEKSLIKLKERNLFGMQTGGNILWKSNIGLCKDSSKRFADFNWVLGAGTQQYVGMQFSKDAFGLLFQGGYPYIGDTMALSGLRLESTSFSKLGIGMVNKHTLSSIIINLVRIQNQISAKTNHSYWYQDEQSAAINLELNGEANFGKPSNSFGVAIDLDYRFGSMQEEQNEQQFQLIVQNFGIARNFAYQKYVLDGPLQFSGLSIMDLQNNNLDTLAQDFLDTLGFQKISQNGWVILPTTVHLAKIIDWQASARIQGYYGAQFLFRQTYTPLVYAGSHIKITDWWQAGVGLAYGGFGGLRVQSYSTLRFKTTQLIIRSDNVAFQNGASIILQLKCEF